MDTCDVAFMIDDNCYAVKCFSPALCKIRPAKPSSLHPQLAFISRFGKGEYKLIKILHQM